MLKAEPMYRISLNFVSSSGFENTLMNDFRLSEPSQVSVVSKFQFLAGVCLSNDNG